MRMTSITLGLAMSLALGTALTASAADESTMTALGGTWKEIAGGPFGSTRAAAAWTGDRLVVVDLPVDFEHQASRAATYDPAADAWAELPAAPRGLEPNSPSAWTGSELLVFDGSQGSGVGYALDPAAGTGASSRPGPSRCRAWRPGRTGRPWSAIPDGTLAAYDPVADAWRELADAPGAKELAALTWTDSAILAVASPGPRTRVWCRWPPSTWRAAPGASRARVP